jgi:hypothetical protein
MGADIDMNSNDIINAGLVSTTELVVDGSDVSSLIQDAVDAVSEAAASATSASTSASVATTKASEAAASAAAAAAALDFDPATKADVGHSHTISDVTDLQTTLDGKAATSHTHAISNVTGLQTELDDKVDVTDLQSALDDKANNTVSITAGTGLTGGGDLTTNRTLSANIATLAEAQAGTSSTKLMTPERTADAIAALGGGSAPDYTSSEQTITPAGLLTLAHGLGSKPSLIASFLRCKVADAGYSVGDEIEIPTTYMDGGTRVSTFYTDGTNIYCRYSSSANVFAIGNKTSGAAVGVVNTSWRMIVRAWK